MIDFLNRKFNPNYKSRKITKTEFYGDWPFYFNEVTLECRMNHWCVVSIDGYDYALNGAASGRYKIEDPHEAGVAILGKSVSEFRDMTFELNKRKV